MIRYEITLFRSPSSMKMERKDMAAAESKKRKCPSISCDWRHKEFLVLLYYTLANMLLGDFQLLR